MRSAVLSAYRRWFAFAPLISRGLLSNIANIDQFRVGGNFAVAPAGAATYMIPIAEPPATSGSDVRLKTNIRSLAVLDRLNGYRAASFDRKDSGRRDIGVIAQERYKTFLDVVNRESEGSLSGPMDPGTWGVQYDRLRALTLAAAKKLKAENGALRDVNRAQAQRPKALEARIMRLEVPEPTTAPASQN